MDETTVREHAEAHGKAVIDGDLGRAASDLTDEAKQQAPAVMKQLPSPAKSVSVESLSTEGDRVVAVLQYAGDDHSATVESRWIDQNGRPMIENLRVV